jgi:hypothetical protein
MAVDQERPDRLEIVAAIVAQSHDQVEPPLPTPHLRAFMADQARADRTDDIARRQAHARGGLAIHGDLQLREARQGFSP